MQQTGRPAPSSFHVDHADIEKLIPAAHERERGREFLLVSIVRDLSMVVFGVLLPIYFLGYDRPPEFSVQLPAISWGLDGPPGPGGGGASISPAFDVALRVANRRDTGRCYHGGEALVSYAGFTVTAGQVRGSACPARAPGRYGSRRRPMAAAWVCPSACWTAWLWSAVPAPRSSTSR